MHLSPFQPCTDSCRGPPPSFLHAPQPESLGPCLALVRQLRYGGCEFTGQNVHLQAHKIVHGQADSSSSIPLKERDMLHAPVPSPSVPAEANVYRSTVIQNDANIISCQSGTCILRNSRVQSAKQMPYLAVPVSLTHMVFSLAFHGLFRRSSSRAQTCHRETRRCMWVIILLVFGMIFASGANGQTVTLPASLGDEFSCFIVQGHVVCCGNDGNHVSYIGRMGVTFGPYISRRIVITPTAIFDRS
jgi:hypothetical protein